MSTEMQETLTNETIAAAPRFEEHLAFVIDVTLSGPEVYQRNLQTIQNHDADDKPASDVNQPGLRAPINILEKSLGAPSCEEVDNLLLPFEVAIQQKIEAFGQSILDEAFDCLGDDAMDMVIKAREAKTKEEVMQVTYWLQQRMANIRFNASYVEEYVDGNDYYHPIRLSPKFIEKYPDIGVPPTCLGYSILVASFFEKAGLPYLHAGVVSTASNQARQAQNSIIEETIKTVEKWGITTQGDLDYKFGHTLDYNREEIENHRGFHAANLVRFDGLGWLQIDTNFNLNIFVEAEKAGDIEQAFHRLLDIREQARGVEETIAYSPSCIGDAYLRAMIEQAQKNIAVEDIEQFFIDAPDDLSLGDICNYYFQDILKAARSTSETDLSEGIYEYCNRMRHEPIDYLEETIDGILMDYVFMEGYNIYDISRYVARAKCDESYRRQIAESLKMAPLYAILRMQSDHGDAIIEGRAKSFHAVMDVGLPAYRVGMSVLSDFAVYCGDELPLSFWMTYWPSAVSFAEHCENTPTLAQQELYRQLIRDLGTRALNYSVISDIVSASTIR